MIPREFFERSPRVCARELIGAELVWGECRGRIVETEAYEEFGDSACHTFSRPGARAFVERHPAGTAYVYLNYGMHWLLNALVKGPRKRGFVLIRALEPLAGGGVMQARRGMAAERKWCAGPGRLTQALGITGEWYGRDLCGDPEHAFVARSGRPRVVADGRIGISVAADRPWRFTLEGSPFVSVRPRVEGGKK